MASGQRHLRRGALEHEDAATLALGEGKKIRPSHKNNNFNIPSSN